MCDRNDTQSAKPKIFTICPSCGDSKIHAPSTCDFLVPSLSVSAMTTPTLQDNLFCSPLRTQVAPLNCNGAGKCIVPDVQGSRRIMVWESTAKSPPQLAYFILTQRFHGSKYLSYNFHF